MDDTIRERVISLANELHNLGRTDPPFQQAVSALDDLSTMLTDGHPVGDHLMIATLRPLKSLGIAPLRPVPAIIRVTPERDDAA